MNPIRDLPPLAERMRPRTLDEIVGQDHLTAQGKPLRIMVEHGRLASCLLYGPPGVGKTTIAKILTQTEGRGFYELSAISIGVKELREVIEEAKKAIQAPVVFIDEIHRFNKGQQDALLGAVEKGTIILIGATTENPSFEINKALLSRMHIYTLKELEEGTLLLVIDRVLATDTEFKGRDLTESIKKHLIQLSGGDARKLLNIVELVLTAFGPEEVIDAEKIDSLVQNAFYKYDKAGEQHYDIISAFIKSLRGSHPDAAVYWMARMIEGGEQPEFIARRMLILAAEDIGLANPNALLIANTAFEAVLKIGWPESRIILSECAIFLATSEKSNSAYVAINQAQALVKQTGNLPVPMHLRNAPTKFMKDAGAGKGYKYAHDYEGNFVNQEFLPEKVKNERVYIPGNNKREEEIARLLARQWNHEPKK